MRGDGLILVTGGGGFIGSALVRRLIADGAPVRVFDDFSRGMPARLAGLPADRLSVVAGDIRNADEVMEALKGVSTVFHLAAINGTQSFYDRPGDVLGVAVRGQINLMDAISAQGGAVGRLVVMSSSEVYQQPAILPTPEDVPLIVPDVLNPRYSYGGGKILAELLTVHSGIAAKRTIIRPHNVYGPDMGFGHVIPQLIEKIVAATGGLARREAEIEIFGDGSATRAFCHIDDAVDGILLAAESDEDPGIYHVGVDTESSVLDLVAELAAVMDVSVSVKGGAAPEGETSRRCPDISKLRGLGYAPSVSLRDGLARTVPWYVDFFGKNAV